MKPPEVPKLHPDIRTELALDIAAYMTEQAANLRGIALAAPDTKEKMGPKDWWPVYGIRYTREAQEIFNGFFELGLKIVKGVFGPGRITVKPRMTPELPISKIPQAAPELPNSIRIELASEIASAMTELEAAERGIPLEVQSGGGPKDWDPTHRKPVFVSYTEQAQDLFNEFYDTAHHIVDGIFGPEA